MKLINKSPWTFIILIGVVSLFSDMTHEGARSISGPFLAMLGASATMVGFIAGFGEFMGYAIRLVSGIIADKTKQYWAVTFAGYILNLLAIPALALAGSWQMAAVLIILERTGRAIRNPSRDVMYWDHSLLAQYIFFRVIIPDRSEYCLFRPCWLCLFWLSPDSTIQGRIILRLKTILKSLLHQGNSIGFIWLQYRSLPSDLPITHSLLSISIPPGRFQHIGYLLCTRSLWVWMHWQHCCLAGCLTNME
jgi:hypothetical protein